LNFISNIMCFTSLLQFIYFYTSRPLWRIPCRQFSVSWSSQVWSWKMDERWHSCLCCSTIWIWTSIMFWYWIWIKPFNWKLRVQLGYNSTSVCVALLRGFSVQKSYYLLQLLVIISLEMKLLLVQVRTLHN